MSVIPLRPATPQPLLGPNGHPLRVVILECPYDTLIENSAANQLYPHLLTLKIKGYRAVYPYGVLPMDTADFIANHIILAEETPEGFIPHTAFKSITLSRCKTHFLDFPAFNLLKITDSQPSQAYRRYLEKILEEATAKGEEVGYNGSWTVSKDLQKMKDRFDFRKASITLMARYYTTYNIKHIIAAASAKYKVDHLKVFMGYDYFSEGSERLAPLNLVPYGSEPFYMMHLKEFSQQTFELCEVPEYRKLWEERVTIAPAAAPAEKKAA